MKALQIVNALEQFRPPDSPISLWSAQGRDLFEEQIQSFVARGQRIEFLMLGYPFKSTNHDHKTLGVLPDLAELVSFDNWRRFGEAVKAVYSPGVNIRLVSDGHAFSDLLDEKDATVDSYAELTADYATGAPVQIMSLQDFYPVSPSEGRRKLEAHFGIPELELEARILSDPDVTALYRGMIHFMEEELENRPFASKRQRHLSAKSLARKMMLRNEAYSAMVQSELSGAIRLSMHKTTNLKKFAFQLIPGAEAWHSPWHCALLVRKDGSYATVHKKDAITAGWELVNQNGRAYHYAE